MTERFEEGQQIEVKIQSIYFMEMRNPERNNLIYYNHHKPILSGPRVFGKSQGGKGRSCQKYILLQTLFLHIRTIRTDTYIFLRRSLDHSGQFQIRSPGLIPIFFRFTTVHTADCAYCGLCILRTVHTADCAYCGLCILRTVHTVDCAYCGLRFPQYKQYDFTLVFGSLNLGNLQLSSLTRNLRT